MNNRMLYCIVLIFIALLGSVTAGTLYKKVNKDGSVEYSDQPFTGAKPVEFTINNQTQLPPLRRQQDSGRHTNSQATDYAISIQSPSPQQSIRSNSGDLTIMVQTTPALTRGLLVQLFINNAPHGKPSQHTVFKVKNIDRGEVKIKAQLITSYGNVLASSPEAIVYLHRATVRRAN